MGLGSWFKNTRDKGGHFERLAEHYLTNQGLNFVARNYTCRYGEIDLIMRHQQTLVFVEVKYRKGAQFGGALHSLTTTKQQRLRRSIEHYLIAHHASNQPVRVDFVEIEGTDNIHWLQNIL